MRVLLIVALFIVIGINAQDADNDPEYPLNKLLCETIAQYVDGGCSYEGNVYCDSCQIGVEVLLGYCRRDNAKLAKECQSEDVDVAPSEERLLQNKRKHEEAKIHQEKAQQKPNKKRRQYYHERKSHH